MELTRPNRVLLRRLMWPSRTTFRSRHRRRFPSDPDDNWDLASWPFEAFEADNPFDRAAQPQSQERLWVALHLSALQGLTPDEAFLASQLVTDAKDWGLRVFATGHGGAQWDALPLLEVEERSDFDGAMVRVRWNETDESAGGILGLHGLREWAERTLPRTAHRAALDVLAAHELGAHLVVTTDRHLLRLRTDARLRDVNLLSPTELGPVMGVWARATGAGGSFAHVHPSGSLYYWCLARALTPAGWPAFGAWVHGERTFPRGRLLVDLAQSVLTRLDFLLRTLDEMAVVWQREVSNATVDLMTALMDNVLLRIWAIQDNLALLVGRWFEIELKEDAAWSLTNARWREAIRAAGGGATLDAIADSLRPIRASEQLRHHAVHRESLSGIRLEGDTGMEARIRLWAPLSTDMRTSLRNASQRPETWGLGEEIPVHFVHHSVDHGDGLREEFEAEDPGGAFLDPMPFCAQLVASVARLANTVFEVLDPAADVRLSGDLQDRARRVPEDAWFRPEFGWQFALTSPLAGLVPWAEAHAVGAQT